MLQQISEVRQEQGIEIRHLVLETEEPILIYIDRHVLTADEISKPSKIFMAIKVSAGVLLVCLEGFHG